MASANAIEDIQENSVNTKVRNIVQSSFDDLSWQLQMNVLIILTVEAVPGGLVLI